MNNWRSVRDNPPTGNNRMVLVVAHKTYWDSGRPKGDRWRTGALVTYAYAILNEDGTVNHFESDRQGGTPLDVSHWQPLPALPEGVK